MKMNDGEIDADKVIQVDPSGNRDHQDLEVAWKEALLYADRGDQVLLLIHPGDYLMKSALPLHANIHMRGVPAPKP